MLISLDDLHYKYSLKINGVIHIGAFVGEEYPSYLKFGVHHSIFFEPQNEIFKVLSDRIVAHNHPNSNVILVNKALGSENKEAELFLSSTPGGIPQGSGASSSILKPKKHLEQHPHITFPTTQKTEVVRLDDFWNFSGLDSSYYNFVNIDVQGYELEVLKGAEKTLENIDYVMAEVNRDEVYENCAQVEEIDSFLGGYGFSRVETSWDGGTWGDAFYVKS